MSSSLDIYISKLFFDIAKESAYKVFTASIMSIQGNEYCCLLYMQNDAVEVNPSLILYSKPFKLLPTAFTYALNDSF